MSTFDERPPEVSLVTYTPNPLSAMYEIWQTSRDYPILPPGLERRNEEVEVFRTLLFEFTQIPEMVKFTWWLEGMPRSFFDQLTRYRKTGWFARSQRIRDQRGFAGRGEYLTTPSIAGDEKSREIYDIAMSEIDSTYAELISRGIPVEEARGILPLHLRTGMAWTTTLRDLVDAFRARTCCLLQQDYWAHVTIQMKGILGHIDPEFITLFQPPCKRENKCAYPMEAEARYKAIKGGRRDLHPCEIYTRTYANSIVRKPIFDMVDSGELKWATTMEELDRA